VGLYTLKIRILMKNAMEMRILAELAKNEIAPASNALLMRVEQEILDAAAKGKRTVNILLSEDEKKASNSVVNLLMANSYTIGLLTNDCGFWDMIRGRVSFTGIQISWPNQMPGIGGS
jgi:hypothetical protein